MLLRAFDNKYLEIAKHFFDLMRQAYPENPLPRNELYHILKAQGEHEAAKQILREALEELENTPPMMFYDYGMLLKEEGNVDEAIEWLEKGAAIEVYHPIEHELGHLYFAKEDYASAIHWYTAALASAEGAELSSMQSIVDCAFLLKDYPTCAIMLMELLLFTPDSKPHYWDNLQILFTLAHIDSPKVRLSIGLATTATTTTDRAAFFDQLVEEMAPGQKRNWMALQEGVDPFEH